MKVSYHGNVIIALDNLPDLPHFVLHIARPDLTDYLTGICKCGWHVGRSSRELKPQQSHSARTDMKQRQCDEERQLCKRMERRS